MSCELEFPVDFDQYQRYKTISLVIEHFRKDLSSKFRILEIGSNEFKGLKLFLPNDDILFTDITLTDLMKQDPEFQIADGTNLLFEDQSFDFVIAADVLEHIPKEERGLLLSEAIRVAKYSAIVSFPYGSPEVLGAEKRISTYYKALYGEDFIWTKEHAKYGLPILSDIDDVLEGIECNFCHVIHGDLTLWERMYYSIFDALKIPEEWEFRRQIDFYYFRELYSGDVSESCYRAYYVLSHVDIEPQKKALEARISKQNLKELRILDTLLEAQRNVHWQYTKTAAKKDMEEKDTCIASLEAQKQYMEFRWKTDVERWQADVDRWTADVRQWENDIRVRETALNEQQVTIESLRAQLLKLQDFSDAQFQRNEQAENQIRQLSDALAFSENQSKQLGDALVFAENQIRQLSDAYTAAENELSFAKQQLLQSQQTLLACEGKLQNTTDQLEAVQYSYSEISNAFFWRITKPLRQLLDFIKKLGKN